MSSKTITTNISAITSGVMGMIKYPSVPDISVTASSGYSFTTSTTGTSPDTGYYLHELDPEEVTLAVKVPEFHPEWNCKLKNFANKYLTVNSNHEINIVNITIVVPNKVVEVTVYDGNKSYKYKQVCKEPDVFDLRFALALAIIKYKNETGHYPHHLTSEGVEEMADRSLRYYKEFAKEVDRAIKAYNKWLKEEEKKKLEEEERKAIIERRRAKNKKRKEKMKAKKHDEEVNTIAEAIRKSKEDK